jgi:hypothetical protein
VVIRLKNGDTLDTGAVARIRGHAYEPLTTAELWEKFAACTAQAYAPRQAKALFDMLQALGDLRSTQELPTCGSIFTKGD